MDPDKALEEIRELVEWHGKLGAFQVERLVELVAGLDGWLATGGFKPKAWGGDPAFPLPPAPPWLQKN